MRTRRDADAKPTDADADAAFATALAVLDAGSAAAAFSQPAKTTFHGHTSRLKATAAAYSTGCDDTASSITISARQSAIEFSH